MFPGDDPEIIIYAAVNRPKDTANYVAPMVKEVEQNITKYLNIEDSSRDKEEYVVESFYNKNVNSVKEELESKNINFMLNKDLIETFEREITGSSEVNSNSTTNANGTTTANSNDMMYDTPNSRIDDMTKYPTQGSQGENNATSSSNATSTNNQTGENTQTEKTSLISKGNIGITSSAQLLKEWREVLINIDEIIINDCRNLFLKIY